MSRIASVREAARNLNRRLEASDSQSRVFVQQRNGHCAVDEIRASNGATIRSLVVGTKSECHEALFHMMRGIDLASQKEIP